MNMEPIEQEIGYILAKIKAKEKILNEMMEKHRQEENKLGAEITLYITERKKLEKLKDEGETTVESRAYRLPI